MVFHRYAMSASLPLSTREFFLFLFFFTTNKSADDGSGQVCGPILRAIPVSCSTARFDDSNPFRGETRAAKKKHDLPPPRYTTVPPTVCIFTRARVYAYGSFPFKYLPTKHSSPPPLLPHLRAKMKTWRAAADGEPSKGGRGEIVVGEEIVSAFLYLERGSFFSRARAP